MSSQSKIYDAIVVGAGISGLYAARCMVKEGLDVLILEASDHVGGRTLVQRDPSCQYADLGGAYVGTSQTKILELMRELGLETYDVPDKGKSVVLRGSVRFLFEDDIFPMKHWLALLDLNHAIRIIDHLSKQVPLEAPWTAPKAAEWDKISSTEFVKNLCWTNLVRDLVIHIIETIHVHECHPISLLFWLLKVRSCGGMQALISSSKGLQAMKIKGGSSSVSEKMAEALHDRLTLNTAVCSIDQTQDIVEIKTTTGQLFKCRRVVVAACPVALRHITFTPALPSAHQAYINHRPSGSVFKIFMYYTKPYWLEKGLKGEFLSPGRMVAYGIADTKHDGSHPAILSFLVGDEYSKLTKDERKQRLCELYAEVFQIPEMKDPIGYVEKYWGDDEENRYTGVCVYSVPTGFLTTHKALWGERYDRIHFADSESSVIMRGYMDGGLRAAERAAVEVFEALDVKTSSLYDTTVREIPYLKPSFVESALPSVPGFFTFMGAAVVGVLASVMAARRL